jgi:hypothetical protein
MTDDWYKKSELNGKENVYANILEKKVKGIEI